MRGDLRPLLLVLAASCLPITLTIAEGSARAEWGYDNGFGFEAGGVDARVNIFLRPYYEYEDGNGESASTFALDLAGGRMRVRVPRRRITVQLMGGLSGDEGVLLDSYLDLGIGDVIAVRAGYFRVPFDEQTTHCPFWLRMSRRSIDVLELGHEYDMGIALRGSHLDDALVWALSMTNGDTDWENANIDFLYSLRAAVRLGDLMGWSSGMDLILGLGSSWNLEPWEPEPELQVNRSVFNETLDLTLMARWLTVNAAALYRVRDPGAYGPLQHALGWHAEVGANLAGLVEIVARFSQLFIDLESDRQQIEVGTALNGFGDEGRMRFQLEYSYLTILENDEAVEQTHRVAVVLQAFY